MRNDDDLRGENEMTYSNIEISRLLQALVLLAALAVCGATWPGGARADAEVGSPGSGAGQMSQPGGLAVDASSELLFVADSGNNRIDVFNASTRAFVRAFGWGVLNGASELQTCTTTCRAGIAGSGQGQLSNPRLIALDATTHTLYVAEPGNHRVQKFDANGNFLLSFGGAGTLAEEGKFETIRGIGTSASGVVYVVDIEELASSHTNKRVQKFTAAGSPIAPQIVLPGPALGEVNAFAVDSAGNFYVGSDNSTGIARKYSPTGTELYSVDPSFNINTMAVGAANGLFISDVTEANSILEYDNTGVEQLVFYYGGQLTEQARGMAVFHSSGGGVFVSGGLSEVVQQISFPPPGPVVRPASTTAPLTQVKSSRATLEALINPESQSTEFRFEYVDQAHFESGGFANPATERTPLTPLSGADFKLHLATAKIPGLAPETTYHFRVFAKNAAGETHGEEEVFTTLAPLELGGVFATEVGSSSARLSGEVNPLGTAATGYFEVVGDAQFQESGFTSAMQTPDGAGGSPPLAFGSGEDLVRQNVALANLAPGSVYHYRFVADDHCKVDPSVVCEFESPAFSFRTFPGIETQEACPGNQAFRIGPGASLPDCRAYEMVSPLNKDNGDTLAAVQVTGYPTAFDKSSVQGNEFTFSSYRAFGAAEGGPFASQYLAARDPASGWTTENISPSRGGHSFFSTNLSIEAEYKYFSEDLGDAWLLHDTDPPLGGCAPAGFADLYRRSNASTAYEPLNCTPPRRLAPGAFNPELQGVSEDGQAAVFSVNDELTADAVAGPPDQVYEAFGDGELVLISILPNGAASTEENSAGTANASITDSKSGTRLQSVTHAVSGDGSRVFWTASPTEGEPQGDLGRVYLRVNTRQPQSTIVAGKCTEPEAACTLPVSQAGVKARFEAANPQGTRALFKIRTGAAGEEVGELFEFDLSRFEEGKAPKLIARGMLKGVLGVSEDATHLYFASREVLTSAPNDEGREPIAGQANLYFYDADEPEGEQFRFIGCLEGNDLSVGSTTINPEPLYHTARVDPSGETALFTSAAPLTGYDNHDASSGERDVEVYLYDAAAEGGEGRLSCLSCNPSGGRPTGRFVQFNRSNVETWTAATIPAGANQLYFSRALSDDGDRAYFDSYDSLVLGDTNGVEDVYQWEAAGTGSCTSASSSYVQSASGCISLISSGEGSSDSEFLDASPSGADVFINTALSLVPQDYGLFDVYDARIGGGFPSPASPPPACQGEACQKPPAPPAASTPLSEVFHGAGNPKQQSKKKSSKKNKKHHKKKHQGRKALGGQGGAGR